jgi:PAS domain S-box-containing protein
MNADHWSWRGIPAQTEDMASSYEKMKKFGGRFPLSSQTAGYYEEGKATGDSGKGRSYITAGFILGFSLLLLLSGESFGAPKGASQSIKIGVLATRGVERCLQKWEPTAEYLTNEIPGYSFTIKPLDFNKIYQAVEWEDVDFILTNPSFYVGLERFYGASRMVTLKNLRPGGAYAVFGGAIFRRADRKDMDRLVDLKGKTFMAVEEGSFGGWLMAWRELKEHEIDPYRDFADLSFGGTHDAVVYAVRDGKVDAGAVRTDALERMAMEGKIRLEDFHVFHEHGGGKVHLPFLHSTRSYPEWTFAEVRHTSNELAERVAIALLNMSPDSPAARAAVCGGWTIPHNYQSVHDCLKYLRVGPYKDYGEVTFRDVIRRYLPWLLGAAISIILIIMFAFHTRWLNQRLQESLAGKRKELAQRKRMEKTLRESEEKYRTLVEADPYGIQEIDTSGIITYTNPAYQKMLGYTEEELLGKSILDLLDSDEAREKLRAYLQILIKDQPPPTTYPQKNRTKSGKTIDQHVDWNYKRNSGGRVIGFTSVITDITERKKAEEEISKFKAIAENALYGISIADPNGNITYVNEYSAEIHGYKREELVGQNLSIFHTEKQLKSVRKITEELKKKGSFNSLEVWHKHRDGTAFPTLMNGVAIKDKGGKVIFMACTATDITELKRLQELAERAQRLESAGTIAGQVAHDFNNLLGPLIAYPELIRENLTEGSPNCQMVEDMEKAATQLAEINQQLLTLGRRGHYNLEPMNLNNVVEQAIRQIRPVPETLIIEKHLSPNLLNMSGGESQILRVVSNMIDNACDAMKNVGQLTIRTENYYLDEPYYKLVMIPTGEYVKLTVSDTGCGIPADILNKIFDPFFTTKKTDRKRGSGLGLSIVHAVMEDHGGYIDCESVPGIGTSFYLYFRITGEDIKPPTEGEIIGGDENILVVDDDSQQRDVARNLLEKIGYTVETVESGEKAIEYINHKPVDLLVLDMITPGGIDSGETYRRVLEINPSQKAIIVSGYAESERVHELLKLGAGAFVRKPLTFKSIARAVRHELDKKKTVPVA